MMIKPLEKNNGGYFGETIVISDVLDRIATAAKIHGWLIETFSQSTELPLYGLSRIAKHERLSAYISSGIHGDEPGGPLTLLEMLEANTWPDDVSLYICPCLNPTGFKNNTRENSIGIDLNRDYRHFNSTETKAHKSWIESIPSFGISICVHEDWEAKGFYLYELNPEKINSASLEILNAVSSVCPIDQSELIDGRPANCGLLKPLESPDVRPLWPEAFYIVQNNKTRLSYTLEAPSDFPLYFRTHALRHAIETTLNAHLSEN